MWHLYDDKDFRCLLWCEIEECMYEIPSEMPICYRCLYAGETNLSPTLTDLLVTKNELNYYDDLKLEGKMKCKYHTGSNNYWHLNTVKVTEK
jgi:hypothetical protein